MLEGLLISSLIIGSLSLLFFVFVMLAQMLFMVLMKIRNWFVRWLSVLVAIVMVAVGLNMIISGWFTLLFSSISFEMKG